MSESLLARMASLPQSSSGPVSSPCTLLLLDLRDAQQVQEMATSLCTDEERRRFSAMRPGPRATRTLCRALVRQQLATMLGVHTRDIAIVEHDDSRPTLDLKHRDAGRRTLDFNVSHSADLGALAICERGRVGVDVERIKSRANEMAIATATLSSSEVTALGALAGVDRAARFAQFWCAREATLKATGAGVWGGMSTTEIERKLDAAGNGNVVLSDGQCGQLWEPVLSQWPEYRAAVVWLAATAFGAS